MAYTCPECGWEDENPGVCPDCRVDLIEETDETDSEEKSLEGEDESEDW